MLVGYARTSTLEQEAGLEAQIRDLKANGCERVFAEQVSSVAPRKVLESVMDFVRQGDTLAVTKLDRFARSVPHMWELVGKLRRKGADFRVINLGLDSATPTGKLQLSIMGAVAEFEREMMLERQREGIAKAKGEGRYKGRKPTARAKASEIKGLHASGFSMRVIAKQLGISTGSVHGVLNPKGAEGVAATAE